MPFDSSTHDSRVSRMAWALAKRSMGTMDLSIASLDGPSSPFIMANRAMHSANIGVFITREASNAMAVADSPVPMMPSRIIIRLRS